VEWLDNERGLTQNPLVVVISGPSGVGKDVIIDQMIASRRMGFHFIVTTTTRSSRHGEQEGINHNFVTVDHFKRLIKSKRYLNGLKFTAIITVFRKYRLVMLLQQVSTSLSE